MSPAEMSSMIVAEVMRRWPATVPVFNAKGMACPGCVMAPFMTVVDAAAAYALDAAALAASLVSAIDDGQRSSHSGDHEKDR